MTDYDTNRTTQKKMNHWYSLGKACGRKGTTKLC